MAETSVAELLRRLEKRGKLYFSDAENPTTAECRLQRKRPNSLMRMLARNQKSQESQKTMGSFEESSIRELSRFGIVVLNKSGLSGIIHMHVVFRAPLKSRDGFLEYSLSKYSPLPAFLPSSNRLALRPSQSPRWVQAPVSRRRNQAKIT